MSGCMELPGLNTTTPEAVTTHLVTLFTKVTSRLNSNVHVFIQTCFHFPDLHPRARAQFKEEEHFQQGDAYLGTSHQITAVAARVVK